MFFSESYAMSPIFVELVPEGRDGYTLPGSLVEDLDRRRVVSTYKPALLEYLVSLRVEAADMSSDRQLDDDDVSSMRRAAFRLAEAGSFRDFLEEVGFAVICEADLDRDALARVKSRPVGDVDRAGNSASGAAAGSGTSASTPIDLTEDSDSDADAVAVSSVAVLPGGGIYVCISNRMHLRGVFRDVRQYPVRDVEGAIRFIHILCVRDAGMRAVDARSGTLSSIGIDALVGIATSRNLRAVLTADGVHLVGEPHEHEAPPIRTVAVWHGESARIVCRASTGIDVCWDGHTHPPRLETTHTTYPFSDVATIASRVGADISSLRIPAGPERMVPVVIHGPAESGRVLRYISHSTSLVHLRSVREGARMPSDVYIQPIEDAVFDLLRTEQVDTMVYGAAHIPESEMHITAMSCFAFASSIRMFVDGTGLRRLRESLSNSLMLERRTPVDFVLVSFPLRMPIAHVSESAVRAVQPRVRAVLHDVDGVRETFDTSAKTLLSLLATASEPEELAFAAAVRAAAVAAETFDHKQYITNTPLSQRIEQQHGAVVRFDPSLPGQPAVYAFTPSGQARMRHVQASIHRRYTSGTIDGMGELLAHVEFERVDQILREWVNNLTMTLPPRTAIWVYAPTDSTVESLLSRASGTVGTRRSMEDTSQYEHVPSAVTLVPKHRTVVVSLDTLLAFGRVLLNSPGPHANDDLHRRLQQLMGYDDVDYHDVWEIVQYVVPNAGSGMYSHTRGAYFIPTSEAGRARDYEIGATREGGPNMDFAGLHQPMMSQGRRRGILKSIGDGVTTVLSAINPTAGDHDDTVYSDDEHEVDVGEEEEWVYGGSDDSDSSEDEMDEEGGAPDGGEAAATDEQAEGGATAAVDRHEGAGAGGSDEEKADEPGGHEHVSRENSGYHHGTLEEEMRLVGESIRFSTERGLVQSTAPFDPRLRLDVVFYVVHKDLLDRLVHPSYPVDNADTRVNAYAPYRRAFVATREHERYLIAVDLCMARMPDRTDRLPSLRMYGTSIVLGEPGETSEGSLVLPAWSTKVATRISTPVACDLAAPIEIHNLIGGEIRQFSVNMIATRTPPPQRQWRERVLTAMGWQARADSTSASACARVWRSYSENQTWRRTAERVEPRPGLGNVVIDLPSLRLVAILCGEEEDAPPWARIPEFAPMYMRCLLADSGMDAALVTVRADNALYKLTANRGPVCYHIINGPAYAVSDAQWVPANPMAGLLPGPGDSESLIDACNNAETTCIWIHLRAQSERLRVDSGVHTREPSLTDRVRRGVTQALYAVTHPSKRNRPHDGLDSESKRANTAGPMNSKLRRRLRTRRNDVDPVTLPSLDVLEDDPDEVLWWRQTRDVPLMPEEHSYAWNVYHHRYGQQVKYWDADAARVISTDARDKASTYMYPYPRPRPSVTGHVDPGMFPRITLPAGCLVFAVSDAHNPWHAHTVCTRVPLPAHKKMPAKGAWVHVFAVEQDTHVYDVSIASIAERGIAEHANTLCSNESGARRLLVSDVDGPSSILIHYAAMAAETHNDNPIGAAMHLHTHALLCRLSPARCSRYVGTVVLRHQETMADTRFFLRRALLPANADNLFKYHKRPAMYHGSAGIVSPAATALGLETCVVLDHDGIRVTDLHQIKECSLLATSGLSPYGHDIVVIANEQGGNSVDSMELSDIVWDPRQSGRAADHIPKTPNGYRSRTDPGGTYLLFTSMDEITMRAEAGETLAVRVDQLRGSGGGKTHNVIPIDTLLDLSNTGIDLLAWLELNATNVLASDSAVDARRCISSFSITQAVAVRDVSCRKTNLVQQDGFSVIAAHYIVMKCTVPSIRGGRVRTETHIPTVTSYNTMLQWAHGFYKGNEMNDRFFAVTQELARIARVFIRNKPDEMAAAVPSLVRRIAGSAEALQIDTGLHTPVYLVSNADRYFRPIRVLHLSYNRVWKYVHAHASEISDLARKTAFHKHNVNKEGITASDMMLRHGLAQADTDLALRTLLRFSADPEPSYLGEGCVWMVSTNDSVQTARIARSVTGQLCRSGYAWEITSNATTEFTTPEECPRLLVHVDGHREQLDMFVDLTLYNTQGSPRSLKDYIEYTAGQVNIMPGNAKLVRSLRQVAPEEERVDVLAAFSYDNAFAALSLMAHYSTMLTTTSPVFLHYSPIVFAVMSIGRYAMYEMGRGKPKSPGRAIQLATLASQSTPLLVGLCIAALNYAPTPMGVLRPSVSYLAERASDTVQGFLAPYPTVISMGAHVKDWARVVLSWIPETDGAVGADAGLTDQVSGNYQRRIAAFIKQLAHLIKEQPRGALLFASPGIVRFVVPSTVVAYKIWSSAAIDFAHSREHEVYRHDGGADKAPTQYTMGAYTTFMSGVDGGAAEWDDIGDV